MTDNDRLTNLRPPSFSRQPQEEHPALPPAEPHAPLTDWEKREAEQAGWSEDYYRDVKHARNIVEFEAAHRAEADRRKPKP